MRFLLTLLFASGLALAGTNDSFLIRGATVFPVTGPKVEGASLLVIDGKIAELGTKVTPPKGIKIIEGKGLSVYPGMIDSATEAGLSEISSVRETSDVSELGDFKPQLRAAVAVNPASEHIPVIRANGITSVMVMPGGGIIAGQAGLMHTDGWTWEEMLIRRGAAMVMLFPTLTPGFGGGAGGFGRAVGGTDARRTYERRIRLLKDYMESARRYQKAKAAAAAGFKTDLALEAMLPVLDRKVPLMITAQREAAIKDAVKWADQERVRIVIAGIRKPGATLADLKAKNIPVILPPTQALPLEEDDPYDQAFTLPNEVYKAGVKFAFGTFANQFSRNIPYQAGTAVGYGLPYEEALKAVTINPAEIWGVGDSIGSIEKGKWADIVVTNGDLLEVRTEVKKMFVKGKEVDVESKHTRLYKKYLARP
ncbi:MAG: amidohydrolase family protein [Acidobacteria bacterium]|nr:amidohydrolase family protein [Acidobacteriota bacterium]